MMTMPDVAGFSMQSSASPPLVELRNVTFGYGDRTILRDVSLTIPRGKVTALMGASGGGKTTVLRLIGGQARAQAGQVLLDGQDVGAMSQAQLYAARRRMGMLFQFGALFTDMTVFENVAFPLREHTDLSEGLVRDIVLMKLQAVGLRGARDLMPSQISGGMARRVALARAMALDPEFIMYDEPFAGLDPISLGTSAQLIRELNDALGLTRTIWKRRSSWPTRSLFSAPAWWRRRVRLMRCVPAAIRWCTSLSTHCRKAPCLSMCRGPVWMRILVWLH